MIYAQTMRSVRESSSPLTFKACEDYTQIS